jgi:glycosyltransferase involved in cell wall biosynthesis
MKVTVILPLPPVKSLNPYCAFLVQALRKHLEFEVLTISRTSFEFLYPGGTKDSTEHLPDFDNINTDININFLNPLTWIKVGLRAKGDLVHLQHWKTSVTLIYCLLVPILKIKKKKIIFSVHNVTPHSPNRLLIVFDRLVNRYVFHFADGFIIHNEKNKRQFTQLYPLKDRPVFVIPVGLHHPWIPNQLSRQQARDALGITPEKKVLLAFGYLWEYKGLDVLLNALDTIAESVPEILLLVAGSVIADWRRYEKIIQEKNLNRYIVRHLNYIPEPEVGLYFTASDLVVLPYIPPFDTHGGIGALAVGMEKPLLVSDIGGLPEFVCDQRAIVRSGDVGDLARKTIQILMDETLLAKLKDDAKIVAEGITWESVAQKTIKAYELVLSHTMPRTAKQMN